MGGLVEAEEDDVNGRGGESGPRGPEQLQTLPRRPREALKTAPEGLQKDRRRWTRLEGDMYGYRSAHLLRGARNHGGAHLHRSMRGVVLIRDACRMWGSPLSLQYTSGMLEDLPVLTGILLALAF
eukprot:1162001-Pyramimonas_sp.AAC.1